MCKFNVVQGLFPNRELTDMCGVIHDLVDFRNLGRDSIKAVSDWLNKHSCQYNQTKVVLYHGTLAAHDITEQGIKRTTTRTRRSMQTTSGYVYLSIYPSMAKTFAEMAYPGQPISVYAVEVPVLDLKADADQLKNARIWKELPFDIKLTVADSLVIGSGIRVKRDIKPYDLKKLPD